MLNLKCIQNASYSEAQTTLTAYFMQKSRAIQSQSEMIELKGEPGTFYKLAVAACVFFYLLLSVTVETQISSCALMLWLYNSRLVHELYHDRSCAHLPHYSFPTCQRDLEILDLTFTSSS